MLWFLTSWCSRSRSSSWRGRWWAWGRSRPRPRRRWRRSRRWTQSYPSWCQRSLITATISSWAILSSRGHWEIWSHLVLVIELYYLNNELDWSIQTVNYVLQEFWSCPDAKLFVWCLLGGGKVGGQNCQYWINGYCWYVYRTFVKNSCVIVLIFISFKTKSYFFLIWF